MDSYLYDGYDYRYGSSASNYFGIIVFLSAVGAFLLYFIFLSKKNEGKFTGIIGQLYDFLNFKKLILESILKILYLFAACFMTLGGFIMLFNSFGLGISMITLGNIMARITYEFALLIILICKNTSDINRKMKSNISGSSEQFASEIEFTNQERTSTSGQPTLYCTHCGGALKEKDEFCQSCGSKSK